MQLDYDTVTTLREQHPAWRLLTSGNAALAVSFLHRVFVEPNAREIPQADLIEALEDDLLGLRHRFGPDRHPKPARAYLDDWASPEHGWLRKYYITRSDEPRFDLTPAAEQAIRWLATLTNRSFVGTESRLLTLFELLRQMHEGSQANPEARIANLRRRRAEIDAEIAAAEAGTVPILDDTELRDRFDQFMQTSRDLLSDFRQVEQNFRELDRSVREQITTWDDSKGALLADIMGERDAISDSDQGRNFAAFWDYLMSSSRQEELSTLLEEVLALDAIAALHPDPRTRRLHYDWLDAGEHAQRTVARLSKQLRRFLDDQAWLENRRIMEILRSIETSAVAVRSDPPKGTVMSVDGPTAEINLPMQRPLAGADHTVQLADPIIDLTEVDIDDDALFDQFVVDKQRLEANIRQALRTEPQITLAQLVERRPVEQGLAEVVGYLELAHHSSITAMIDDDATETVFWTTEPTDTASPPTPPSVPTTAPSVRRARVPRIIFVGAA
ncbi:MAG: DUF3375 domain-containing protein [Actinomycetota bacterium]